MDTNQEARRAASPDPPYKDASPTYLRNIPKADDTPDGRERGRAELPGGAPAGTASASAGSASGGPVRGFGGNWLTSMFAGDRGVSSQTGIPQAGDVDEKGVVAAAGSHPASAAPHPPASGLVSNNENENEVFSPSQVGIANEHGDMSIVRDVLRESVTKLHQAEQRTSDMNKRLEETEEMSNSTYPHDMYCHLKTHVTCEPCAFIFYMCLYVSMMHIQSYRHILISIAYGFM